MADPTRRSTRFSIRSKQLGQLLLESGDVQSEQVAAALQYQEKSGGLLGQILQEQGACTAQAVGQALLKQVQVTDIRCEELRVSGEVSSLLSREFCEAEKLCPFERLGSLLCVVMGNPLNRRAITQIEEKTRLKVKSFKSVWPKISELIQTTYSGGAEEAPAEEPAGESNDFALQPGPGDAAPIVEVSAEEPAAVEAVAEEPMQPREVVAGQASARRREPSAELKIEGIDNLDEAKAEMVETTRRGLSARARTDVVDEAPPKPRPAKVAKVNVDLDALDMSSGEVVKTGGLEEDEHYEEISHGSAAADRPIKLQVLQDGFFYEDGKAPGGERSDELLEVISALPVAEVVAESIGDYHAKKSAAPAKEAHAPAPKPTASRSQAAAQAVRPLELEPSPVAAMAAVPLAEMEFQRHISKLGEDPVGEWDWQFFAPGPVPVLEYEEN
jgi:hypothetical protein